MSTPKPVARVSYESRPARVQVTDAPIRTVDKDGGPINVWTGRAVNAPRYPVFALQPTRVNVAKDAGYTRAGPGSPICLYFAKGSCTLGPACQYFHRIPTATDPIDSTKDVFGRSKWRDVRQDRSGVGSFEKPNKTLYVGGLPATATEADVVKVFQEFGDLAKARLLTGKSVAFVTYDCILNAEFAKEAMWCQMLFRGGRGKPLNLRWATDDPNPRVVEEVKVAGIVAVADAVSRVTEPTWWDAEAGDGDEADENGDADRPTKRVRREGATDEPYYDSASGAWMYPDGNGGTQAWTPEQIQAYYHEQGQQQPANGAALALSTPSYPAYSYTDDTGAVWDWDYAVGSYVPQPPPPPPTDAAALSPSAKADPATPPDALEQKKRELLGLLGGYGSGSESDEDGDNTGGDDKEAGASRTSASASPKPAAAASKSPPLGPKAGSTSPGVKSSVPPAS